MVDVLKMTVFSGMTILLCLVSGGCRSRSVDAQPSLAFDQVPLVAKGGAGTTDTVRGHVENARPGQRVVLYVLGGTTWWVQPLTIQPFTSVAPDGSWSSPTHLGTQYAALLVEPGYVPPNRTETLPVQGGKVVALATVSPQPASTSAGQQTLRFSGYDWNIRRIGSDRNGSPHEYDPVNVNVDADGFLHLRLSKSKKEWNCSEVSLPRSLGYGTYSFSVKNTADLEPAAVLSMFTWDEAGTDQDRREVDFEVSRWGEPANKNAQFIVQPFYKPANTDRYVAPPGPLTFSFHWSPKQIVFKTLQGSGLVSNASSVVQHTFSSDVPVPRTESVHINLCTFAYARVPQQKPTEVIFERFQYLP